MSKNLLLLLMIAAFAMESMNEPQNNAHEYDFLTDEPANVLNFVQRNEPIETKELEMFRNVNRDLRIIEMPEKCTICFEIIEDDKEKFTAECKHIYHYGCIQTWLENHRDCPMCRRKICWCQVWIPFDEFQKTKKRVPFPFEQIDENRLNQVQNVELQRIADHENQQNHLQNHAPYFQQNLGIQIANRAVDRRNHQDLLPLGPQQNQIQNALLADHAQDQLQVSVWWPALLFYGLFSILEVFIVTSDVYVPKWHDWFVAMQIFNVIVLVSTILEHIISVHTNTLDFGCSFTMWLVTFALTYHSVTGFLLSGNNLGLASFFPWFAAIFFPLIMGSPGPDAFSPEEYSPPVKKYILPASIWILIEISLVCGKLFVPNWSNWFGWMQGFHVASLIMYLVAIFDSNREKKWWNLRGTWNFLVPVGLLTYFSLTAVGLSAVNAAHCFLWPLILFFGAWPCWPCCHPERLQDEWDWQPSRFVESMFFSLWILSQIGIVLARIYVTKWAIWYQFMQGFHLLTFVSFMIVATKCTERIRRNFFFLQAAGLQIIITIASYGSILGFLSSSTVPSFLCAVFLPLFIVLAVFMVLAAVFGRCFR